MNKKTILIIIFSLLILAILIWGLIGSSQASKIGITCDFGVGNDGSVFCWKWHKNIVGEFADSINQIFDN